MFVTNREVRRKDFAEEGEDPDVRSYTQTRVFHFSPETSKPGVMESDIICTINIPLVVRIEEGGECNKVFGPLK